MRSGYSQLAKLAAACVEFELTTPSLGRLRYTVRLILGGETATFVTFDESSEEVGQQMLSDVALFLERQLLWHKVLVGVVNP